MKSFHQIAFAVFLTLGAFSLVLYTSCTSKCGSTTCQNGGSCSDNLCVCPTGFSGNACQTGWSTVVIGTYNCSRANCTPAVSGINAWQSAVTADATNPGFTINISNFDNTGITQVATVDSNINGISQIRISPAAGSYGVNATGTYENGVINLNYTSAGVGGVSGYRCSMVMKKE